MKKETMKEFVENSVNSVLVMKKETKLDDIFILKYKNRVFFKNLWTPELLECRGTIIDGDYNIIQRPFTKIFNRGENGTDIDPDTMVIAVEKVNGFMACATWYRGKLLVSTTGTIDSEYAKLATKWIEPYSNMIQSYPNHSFLFEIIDESDPHIVKETEGLYFLNMREKTWEAKQHAYSEIVYDGIAKQYNIKRPNWKIGAFKDFVKELKNIKHEGFVCFTIDGKQELKMKSPYYLTLKAIARKKDIFSLDITRIDEEYYTLFEQLKKIDGFSSLPEQKRLNVIIQLLNIGD